MTTQQHSIGMINIEKLTKKYGQTIACDIPSLTIGDGELTGIVGNNGAGKTTLFRLMLDLTKSDTGRITSTSPCANCDKTYGIQQIDVAKNEEWKLYTGAYLGECFLIDYLTPIEYLEFLGKISGIKPDVMRERLSRFETFAGNEVLTRDKLIRDLSAGNRQKVGIMAALAGNPTVVILDEPFNFLDPQSQNKLTQTLIDYNNETGATILISSHDLTHTVKLCRRIILLEGGHIIRDIPNNGESTAVALDDYFSAE